MLLKNKIAVIYGGGGAVGSSVARAFAAEGAKVYLAGRTPESLNVVQEKIQAGGGKAETAIVNVFVKTEVENHANNIINKEGRIDISFNLIGVEDVQGKPLSEMKYEHFAQPVSNAMKGHFNTATVAATLMNGSGVILALTANAARHPYPHLGGFGVACSAIESFSRQLAFECGHKGIRVVCLRSAGSPDSPGVDEVFNLLAGKAGISREEFDRGLTEKTMLKRLPLLREIAETAVLMASDKASAVTAAVINLTCGELTD